MTPTFTCTCIGLKNVFFFFFFRFRIRMGTTQKVVLIDTWKLIIFASVNACTYAILRLLWHIIFI